MDEPSPSPASEPGIERGLDPGDRRLARPPSERYQPVEAPPDTGAESTVSVARGTAIGVVAAIATAAVITVFGGVLLVSAGLVVVAAGGGWAVGTALRLGSGGAPTRSGRTVLAAGLGFAAVALGQLGLWLFARSEGGVLHIVDYLGQTFGFLVPLQLIVGTLAAAWAARGPVAPR